MSRATTLLLDGRRPPKDAASKCSSPQPHDTLYVYNPTLYAVDLPPACRVCTVLNVERVSHHSQKRRTHVELWAEHNHSHLRLYNLSRHSRRQTSRHSRLRQERTEVSTLELTAPATLPTSTGPAAGLAVLTCTYVKAVGSRLGTVEQEPWSQPIEVCIWPGGA